MSVNTKELHSYFYLFVVTLVFSAIATEFVILFLLFRENSWMPFEPLTVGFVFCTSFSILGQRLSKVSDIQRWIFVVSGCSTFFSYSIFLDPRIIVANQVAYLLAFPVVAFTGGLLVYGDVLIKVWTFMSQRKMNKGRIALVISACALFILAAFYTYIHFRELVFFFDTHPWAMTLIGILATLLGGIFIGRRTKKS